MFHTIVLLISLMNCAFVRCAGQPLMRQGPITEHHFMPGVVYLTVPRIGMHMCAELCKLTHRCRSFNFDRLYLLCHLLVFESRSDQLQHHQDGINSNIKDWYHVNQGLCDAAGCVGSARCVLGVRRGQQYGVCKTREEVFTSIKVFARRPVKIVKFALSGKYSDRWYGLEGGSYKLVVVKGTKRKGIPINGGKLSKTAVFLDLFTGPCPNRDLHCIYLLDEFDRSSKNRILAVIEPTSIYHTRLPYGWEYNFLQRVENPQSFVLTPQLEALVFTNRHKRISKVQHFQPQALAHGKNKYAFNFIGTMDVYTGNSRQIQADLSPDGHDLLICTAKHKLIYAKVSRGPGQSNLVIAEAVSLEKLVHLNGGLTVAWSKTEAKLFITNKGNSRIYVSYLQASPVHTDDSLFPLKVEKFTAIVTSSAYPNRLYVAFGHVDVIKVYSAADGKDLGTLHVNIIHNGKVTLETNGPCTLAFGRKTCLYFLVRPEKESTIVETVEEPSTLNVTLESRSPYGWFRTGHLLGMAVFPEGKLLLLQTYGYGSPSILVTSALPTNTVPQNNPIFLREVNYPTKVSISTDGTEVVFLTKTDIMYFKDCGRDFTKPTSIINLDLYYGSSRGRFVTWYGDRSFLLATRDDNANDVIVRYVTRQDWI